MNGKTVGFCRSEMPLPGQHLNPFVHKLELPSTYAKIKTGLLTVAVLPARVAAICGLLVVAWCIACVGLYGVSDEDLRTRPMTGWRKGIRRMTARLVRALFAVGGFHWLRVKGEQATRQDAPLLAVAPHSSFVDALAIAYMGAPSIVAKADAAQIPLIGMMCVCRKLRDVIAVVGQLTYLVGGMTITVKGRQVSRLEAPILVIAPHSTFLDAVIVYVTGFPSIIARWESGLNPWLGKLINYTQPVYVWRNDADSRQSTIREITRRATSSQDWPQVLIFPEGTCTNRSCLITFKCGAFYPGVPIQPVILRYPNKMDTVTWTWEGPGALKLLWLTLTQLHTYCEIEFLPVYKPNREEIEDPKLFANNVRKVMAKALGIPVTNFTYDHGRLITTAQRLKLPLGGNLVEVQGLRENLAVEAADEEYLARSSNPAMLTKEQFADRLKVSSDQLLFNELFELCKTDKEVVNWSEYLLAILVITTNGRLLHIIEHLFVMMNPREDGKISRDEFEAVTRRALQWTHEKSCAVFTKISSSSPNFVTFDEFRRYAESSEDLRFLMRDANKTRLKSD